MDLGPRDEAVSPVMGVILMVAITIAVAAVLFFITRQLSESSDEEAPYIQFLRDNQDGQLKVVRYTKDVDLSNIQFKLSRDGYFAYNDEADASGVFVEANTYVQVTTTPGTLIRAGDYFEFCLVDERESASVTMIAAAPDAMVYENSFTGLQQCA